MSGERQLSNIITEIKMLRVRLEELNLKLDIVERKLGNVERSLEANSEVLGLFYEEKFGKSSNWKPRLFDLEKESNFIENDGVVFYRRVKQE